MLEKSSKCPVLNMSSMCMKGSLNCMRGGLKKDTWGMNVERIYEQKRENNKSIFKFVKFNSKKLTKL